MRVVLTISCTIPVPAYICDDTRMFCFIGPLPSPPRIDLSSKKHRASSILASFRTGSPHRIAPRLFVRRETAVKLS